MITIGLAQTPVVKLLQRQRYMPTVLFTGMNILYLTIFMRVMVIKDITHFKIL